MNWPLWALALVSIGVPTIALMLDRIRDYPAPIFIKRYGTVALAAFITILVYALYASNPLGVLIVWGAVGGLLATVLLDIVRMIGVKFNAFPVDMPQMFGAMALGVTPRLPKHVMARMIAMLSELPDTKRKEMMEPRIRAIADLGESERKLFVKMMMDGLIKLEPSKRDRVMKTQIEILASLTEKKRADMMRTMDELTFGDGSSSTGSVSSESSMAVFRSGRMPKLSMATFSDLAGKWGVHTRGAAMDLAAKEAGVSSRELLAAGYLWHFVNGASYGIAYTLLFGSGSWLLAFAWGTFVWLVMMVGMPKMMPMVQLSYPKFAIVPLIAHLVMAVPIGYFALTYVDPSASSANLLGWLIGR